LTVEPGDGEAGGPPGPERAEPDEPLETKPVETRRPLANASNRQLSINFATGYAGLVVAIILSLFLTPITLRHFGNSTYGLWIVITAIGSYVGLFDAGVSTAAAQMVASATALQDDQRIADLLATAQVFFTGTAILAIGVIVALIPFVGHLFSVGTQSVNTARIALLLTGLVTVIAFLSSVPQSAIFGGGRNDRSSLLGIGTNLLTQGSQITVVLLGGGLVDLLLVSVAGALLGFGGLTWIAHRLGFLGQRRGRPSRALLRDLVRSGRRNAVVALGGTIAYSLDAVVVGIILPVHQVTPYDLGLSTANFTRSAATTATGLLLPTYAHSFALNERDRQFRLFSRAVLASMCITVPMVVALFAFGQSLLHLWLGAVPPHTFQVLVALNIVVLLQLPGQQSFQYLTGIGRNKILARIALPAALMNLGMSIGATFWLGPVGPAIGSLPQVVILDFVALPVMACRAMEVSILRYFREAILPLVVPLAGAVAMAAILRGLVGNTSKYRAPFEAVAVTLAAWIALLPYLTRTNPTVRNLLHQNWRRLCSKVRS
jgi:O-antigen/teichoic acid export membrane protein